MVARSRRALLAVLLVAALIGCAGSGTPRSSPTTISGAATTTSTTAPARPLAVTRRDITIVDRGRQTDAAPGRGEPAKPSRTLDVMLLVPDGPGPFPLVEFSHGHNGTGPQAEPLLRPIAAAGYVVAAPTFPLTSSPNGVISDYVNQPADVYFVVDSVIELSRQLGDSLFGRVDGNRIALAGHSLGAMTTVGAVYNSCCAQPRVAAAIVLSGVEAPFQDGDYAARPAVPLLLAHGAMDARIPVDGGDSLFAAATGPTIYLRLPEGTHNGILAGDDGKLVDQAMIAWLDKWLRDDPRGLDGLAAAVTASGLADLRTKNL